MTAAFDPKRRVVAECFGTALLVAAVVGSGIMAENLTRDTALARLTLGELHRDWGEIEASRPLLVAVRGEFEQMAMNWHRAEAERLLRLA